MRRNRTVLLTFVLLAFALTACSSSQPTTRPLYSGSDGIILTFPQSNAVQQFQNDVFTVAARLENDGASDINANNPGFIIASFDPAIVSINSTTISIPLGDGQGLADADKAAHCVLKPGDQPSSACRAFSARGRAQYVPNGDVDFAEFTFKAKPLADSRQSATTPITIQACYPYNTTFIANVCVDRDLTTTNPSAPCQASPLTAQPQGAPIAVTAITPRYTTVGNGVNARYEITLNNLRGGLVLAPGAPSVQTCDLENLKSGTDSTYGRVLVSAKLSTIPLKCSFSPNPDGSGIARFVNNQALIVCTFDGADLPSALVSGTNYQAPLIVTVQYFYISRLTAQLQVMR